MNFPTYFFMHCKMFTLHKRTPFHFCLCPPILRQNISSLYFALYTLNLLFTVLFFCSELGYVADHLNIDHMFMEFIGNYVNRVIIVNRIFDILSKAPLFSNIQDGVNIVQYNVNSVATSSKHEFIL
jgi:hypothetical protein